MAGGRRTMILGAAGRDFHDFNVVYRDDASVEVVAFTAAQISGIAGRRYPPELAGPLYPDGIPILDESELESLIRDQAVDQVVFAYSDVSHEHVMHLASRALAAGADFTLPGPPGRPPPHRIPRPPGCPGSCARQTGDRGGGRSHRHPRRHGPRRRLAGG